MAYTPASDNQIFIQTADKTVSNTAIDTSALGTGIGSKMIKSDSIKVGTRIRIHGEGVYSAPLLLGSMVIRVKLGTTTVAQVTTSSLGISGLINATNKAFTFDCIIVFRSTGPTGSVIVGGVAAYSNSLLGNQGTKVFDDLDNAGAAVTLDTTYDLPIDVSVQWDSASTSRSIRTTIAIISLV